MERWGIGFICRQWNLERYITGSGERDREGCVLMTTDTGSQRGVEMGDKSSVWLWMTSSIHMHHNSLHEIWHILQCIDFLFQAWMSLTAQSWGLTSGQQWSSNRRLTGPGSTGSVWHTNNHVRQKYESKKILQVSPNTVGDSTAVLHMSGSSKDIYQHQLKSQTKSTLSGVISPSVHWAANLRISCVANNWTDLTVGLRSELT